MRNFNHFQKKVMSVGFFIMNPILLKSIHQDLFNICDIFLRCKNKRLTFGRNPKKQEPKNGHAVYNATVKYHVLNRPVHNSTSNVLLGY